LAWSCTVRCGGTAVAKEPGEDLLIVLAADVQGSAVVGGRRRDGNGGGAGDGRTEDMEGAACARQILVLDGPDRQGREKPGEEAAEEAALAGPSSQHDAIHQAVPGHVGEDPPEFVAETKGESTDEVFAGGMWANA
jgi:hypothetical protein